jgi:hypothetical protein
MNFQQGDIVRTPKGAIGVVVGFPCPNLNPPISPIVLVLREDERFGGFTGAFIFHDKELIKLGEVERPYMENAWAWVKSQGRELDPIKEESSHGAVD